MCGREASVASSVGAMVGPGPCRLRVLSHSGYGGVVQVGITGPACRPSSASSKRASRSW